MTLLELLETFRRRAAEAAAIGASAPVASVYEIVLAELLPLSDGNGAAPSTPAKTETWLTAGDVSRQYQVKKRWVYRHARELGSKGGTRRCVRFTESAVRRFFEGR